MPRQSVTSLVLTNPPSLTIHPAAVYLSVLSLGSKRTMEEALNKIASLLTNGECDAYTLDWAALPAILILKTKGDKVLLFT